VLYGSVAGYVGGTFGTVMMRIVDIISALPLTLYVILIMVLFDGGGFISIIFALGLVYWVDMARVVRAQILSLKDRDFIVAAGTMGSSGWYILRKHLIVNSIGPITVTATMQVPSAIFTEAFMSFIGLGVTAPMASWGTMCNDALESLRTAPYQLAFPAAAICITMFAFNFIGDGLRDAFDPQMNR
jgi:oligopeptide transport system permease protein